MTQKLEPIKTGKNLKCDWCGSKANKLYSAMLYTYYEIKKQCICSKCNRGD